MKTFTVNWTIEIDSESPEEAARKALEIHLDPASLSTVFEVYDGEGICTHVDLLEQED